MICKEIGQWIIDNIEQPLELWFAHAQQHCTEAQQWFEERRTEIEEWSLTQETRCQKQECVWICLCCNKWVCWIVDVLIRILTVIIELIEHIVEAVCNIIVTLIFLVIMIMVQVVKWIVLVVVCISESLCGILILLGAIALLGVLVAIVALAVPAFTTTAGSIIPIAATIALVSLLLPRRLCKIDYCRILGAVGWAFKWAIVIGAVIAVTMLSPMSALLVVFYGGLLATLAITLEKFPCILPNMLRLP